MSIRWNIDPGELAAADGHVAHICAMILVLHWDRPATEQAEQQFFCHPACFEKTTHETLDAEPD